MRIQGPSDTCKALRTPSRHPDDAGLGAAAAAGYRRSVLGRLQTRPGREAGDLLAAPVAAAVAVWGRGDEVLVAPIDPALADTAAFCEAYDVSPELSANCVVVAGRRGAETTMAACVVLATTRADVNGVVRRRLDVRKASFAAMDDALSASGMEYGGITPVGLPADWPLLVDAAVLEVPYVVIGSGLRASKIVLPGAALAELPGAQVVTDLGRPAAETAPTVVP
jgi:prolyl-tRNA editing enzyme YbaK/EbsC (Cys-tRNA(Pro) deacylase)